MDRGGTVAGIVDWCKSSMVARLREVCRSAAEPQAKSRSEGRSPCRPRWPHGRCRRESANAAKIREVSSTDSSPDEGR